MTFLVPFDGSELAEAALVRADEYAEALDEAVIVISVIPENRRYAAKTGWINEGDPFDAREVIGDLHTRVTELAPDASFRYERVDSAASEGLIAKRIRRTAAEVDATVVFLGSENAGRIVVPVSSVAGSVAADTRYDVHIVRHREPSAIERLRPKSDFYATD